MPMTVTSPDSADGGIATDGVGHERPDRERDRSLRPPSGLRLVDDVVGSLEEAMLAGELRPGERLIETRLCDELGVSRTTLREALLTLQSRGLVRSEPRRGTFVNRLTRDESLDLCRARAMLEGYAVATGRDRLTDDDFRHMRDLVAELAACRFPRDIPRLIRIDLTFHGILMEAANSPVIHELWSSLNGRMSALILSSLEHHHADAGDIAEFHRVLLIALRGGSRARASDALVAHYIGSGEGDMRSLMELTLAIEAMSASAGAHT